MANPHKQHMDDDCAQPCPPRQSYSLNHAALRRPKTGPDPRSRSGCPPRERYQIETALKCTGDPAVPHHSRGVIVHHGRDQCGFSGVADPTAIMRPSTRKNGRATLKLSPIRNGRPTIGLGC
jgi:hypothetical protein